MDDASWVGWTILGVAGIILTYLLINFIYMNAHESREKDQEIKTEKLQACRTIEDQSLRTLCIVEGGYR